MDLANRLQERLNELKNDRMNVPADQTNSTEVGTNSSNNQLNNTNVEQSEPNYWHELIAQTN